MFFLLHLLNVLTKDDYSIQDITSFHESRLRWPNNMVDNRIEPISRYFGENFEAHIKETNGYVLLNPFSLLTLWQKKYFTKI